MSRFRVLVLLVPGLLAGMINLSGCSGGSGIGITLSPSTTPTINQGATQTITASVTNDSTNAGVTWSISGTGSLSNQTKTSVTYIAPSLLSSNTSATVTATSVANTSVTTSLNITVDAVFEIVSVSLPAATVGVPYSGIVTAGGATSPFTWAIIDGTLPAGLTLNASDTATISISGTPTVAETSTFTLQVTNGAGTPVSQTLNIVVNPPPLLAVATRSLADGTVGANYSQTLQAVYGVPPYSWSIPTGSLPPGLSLAGSGLISGTPTTTGTFSFTVKVTDSSKPTPETATANLNLIIDPSSANNSKLDGNYAFLVNGFDPNGHFMAAGSFVADGSGNITNGVMDTNDPANLQLVQSFIGTYLIGANNLGTMTFTGTGRTFALAMMANGNARIIEFDATGAQDSGVLLKQDIAATAGQISGGYAFGFLGADPQGNRYGMAGAFTADGVETLSGGELDSDGSAGPDSAVAFTGTFSLPTTNPFNGRGTMTINIPSGPEQGTTNYSFYIVSGSELLAIEIDQVAGQGRRLVSGSILQQTGAGSFAASSLNGVSVFETTALVSSSGSTTSQSQVGLLTTTGAGTSTLSADQNTGGTLSTPSSSGTYSVAANGRVTLTSSGIATPDPVLYLVAQNQGFIIGTDHPSVTSGFMVSQSGPFTDASLSGTCAGGSVVPLVSSTTNEVDIGSADGAGNLSFSTYSSSTSGGLKQNPNSSTTYSVATSGRRVTPGSGTPTTIFYMVSPAEFWSLSTNTDAMVELFQQ